MIKLNNKNITYVALADSNNSLKTPKEIWYADSNNSVKLVYRRKDALIEGEDYEKYHWLNGDGSAYIDTLVKNLTNVHYIDLFISVDGVSSGHHIFFGRESVAPYYNSQVVLYYVSDRQNISVWANNVGHEINFADIVGNVTLNFDTNIASTPTDSVDFSISNYNSAFSIFLFASNNNGNAVSPFIGKIKKLEIDNILNLIPCKLLKPVPKWLDANGIRRQVGECGMIDLVSGKFYGNVNSVGTFTVENYYERKEWLVGDGSAYIDTNIIVDVPSLYINTKFIAANFSYYEPLFGSRSNPSESYRGSHIWYIEKNRIRVDVLSSDNSLLFCNIQSGVNSLVLDVPNNVISINDVSETGKLSDYRIKNSIYTFHIFNMKILGDTSDGRHPYNGSFGNFALNDSTHSLNLIPCILTMDLPASMDANNIARTKGTSGMWDLVSDRFYGNVASSGTFKAVNLAEGVDYEVHQWLKTEVAGKIGSMMELPVHSYSFSFSRKIISGTNVPYFYTEGGAPTNAYINTTNFHTIIIWNNVQGSYYLSGQSFDRNDAISIVSSTDGLLVNSQTIPQNTFPAQAIYFGANDNNGTENYTSSITVDGIERYIPVKLLKSIPSKYDANGIARQAGECGMYDTVNDKFYGNVDSSGSFSCVNDS